MERSAETRSVELFACYISDLSRASLREEVLLTSLLRRSWLSARNIVSVIVRPEHDHIISSAIMRLSVVDVASAIVVLNFTVLLLVSLTKELSTS